MKKLQADYTKAIELDPENDENYYYRGYFIHGLLKIMKKQLLILQRQQS